MSKHKTVKSKISDVDHSIINNSLLKYFSWNWRKSGIDKARSTSFIGYIYSTLINHKHWKSVVTRYKL